MVNEMVVVRGSNGKIDWVKSHEESKKLYMRKMGFGTGKDEIYGGIEVSNNMTREDVEIMDGLFGGNHGRLIR